MVLVVQDWGEYTGTNLAHGRARTLYRFTRHEHSLGTGDVALSPGFLAWRDMCTKSPNFDIARLFARGNPHLSAQQCAAYAAPFPDSGYRAATRVFPAMVPEQIDSDGAAMSRQARTFWQTQWQGKTLMAIGMQDPVLGSSVMETLRHTFAGCSEPIYLQHAGHFVQEQGESVPVLRSRIFKCPLRRLKGLSLGTVVGTVNWFLMFWKFVNIFHFGGAQCLQRQ